MSNNIVHCNVERCIHNLNNMCSAQYIHIVGYNNTEHSHETDCHTFELRNFRTSITNISNINIMGAIDQIFTEDQVMNPELKCSVLECVYNNNLLCTADSIKVEGLSSSTIQQTECSTFKRR